MFPYQRPIMIYVGDTLHIGTIQRDPIRMLKRAMAHLDFMDADLDMVKGIDDKLDEAIKNEQTALAEATLTLTFAIVLILRCDQKGKHAEIDPQDLRQRS